MKILVLLHLIVFGIILELHGQERFAKIVDIEQKPQNAFEILSYNNKLLLGYTGIFVDNEDELKEVGSGIIRMDNNGNIYDNLVVKSFSTGIKSLIVDSLNGRIHFSGERYIKNGYPHEFTIKEIEVSNLALLNSYDIKYNDEQQVNYYQINSELIDQHLYVIGSSRNQNNDSISTLVFKLDKNVIDTSILVDLGNGTLSWSSFVNERNNMVVSYMVNGIIGQIVHIIEYDNDLNVLWQYTTENKSTQQLPYICELENGSIVLALSDPSFSKIALLRCINTDKSIAWQFRFQDNNGKILREVNKLKRLKNGDFVGVGSYGNLNLDEDVRIVQVPYIFRFSSTGQLLWEKAFYRDRPVLDYCNGSFRDLVEMENGDLMAVGRLDNYLVYDPVVRQGRTDPDIFIVRLDHNGCLDDSCDMLARVFPDTTSYVENVLKMEEEAVLYPNPTIAYLELLNNEAVSKVSFFSLQGSLIKEILNPTNIISTVELPKGLYLVYIYLKTGKIIKQKIIIK